MDPIINDRFVKVEESSPGRSADEKEGTFLWTRDSDTGRLVKNAVQADTAEADTVPDSPKNTSGHKDTQRSIFDRWADDTVCEKKHPEGWSSANHYMDLGWCWCGQSCPCCRAKVGDKLGACEICICQNQ